MGVGVTFVAKEQADDVHRIAQDLSLEREFAAAGIRTAPSHRPARPPWSWGPAPPDALTFGPGVAWVQDRKVT